MLLICKVFHRGPGSGLEADLVIETLTGRSVVEIKYGERIEKQYFKKLQEIMNDCNAVKGFLINTGEKSYSVADDVSVVSVYDKVFPERIFS